MSLFLSCLVDLLVLHDFLVEVDLCDCRITSSSFSSHCPPGHLHRSSDASGLADCSFLPCCVSPRNSLRTSFCLGRSPFGLSCLLLGLLFCLLLAMLFCLLLAMLFCLLSAVLFSVLFIISLLLDVERCSASASSLRCSSRSPRTGVAPLSSFHHWFVSTGFLAVALSLILPRDTLWQVTSSWMPRLHRQHHNSALRPS